MHWWRKLEDQSFQRAEEALSDLLLIVYDTASFCLMDVFIQPSKCNLTILVLKGALDASYIDKLIQWIQVQAFMNVRAQMGLSVGTYRHLLAPFLKELQKQFRRGASSSIREYAMKSQ